MKSRNLIIYESARFFALFTTAWIIVSVIGYLLFSAAKLNSILYIYPFLLLLTILASRGDIKGALFVVTLSFFLSYLIRTFYINNNKILPLAFGAIYCTVYFFVNLFINFLKYSISKQKKTKK